MYTCALAELLMLVAFTAAFAAAANAARRGSFVDDDEVLSAAPPRSNSDTFDARAFDYWRASMTAILACTFAITSRLGEELDFVPLLPGSRSSRSIACALGLVASFALVERARRRHAEASSFALTIGSAFAALCGVASVFTVDGTRAALFREIALVTTAVMVGGIALLLPSLPVVAHGVRKAKHALFLGAFFLLASAVAELYRVGSARSASRAFEPSIDGARLPLAAAVLFMALAVHHARRVEREGSIAEALAARDSARARDSAP